MSRSPSAGATGLLITAVTLTIIGVATLVPSGEPLQEWTFWCLFCGDQAVADTLANVLLFAPLGAGLALRGVSTRRAWLVGTAVSVAIELLQLVIPGRWAALGDVVFNGVGALAGAYVVLHAAHVLRPPPGRAPWLSLAAGVTASAVITATALLLAPGFPNSTYWGQWTPRLEGLEVYQGKVVAARVGEIPVPSFRLPSSDSVRSLLLGGAALEILAVAGPPPSGLASLVSIADDRSRQIMLVGPDRDDLVFIVRTRASALTLSQPSFRLRTWLQQAAPGDTLHLRIRRDGPNFCITLNGRSRCDLGFTAGRGWSVIHSLEAFPWLDPAPVGVFWLAVIVLPFGIWARLHPATIVGAAAIVFGLGAVPTLFGTLVATPPAQWFGAGAGILAGIGARRRLGRL